MENRTFTVKRAFSVTMYRSNKRMKKEQKKRMRLFHLKEMSLISHLMIFKPTSGFPSEDHTNHIKYTKSMKISQFLAKE